MEKKEWNLGVNVGQKYNLRINYVEKISKFMRMNVYLKIEIDWLRYNFVVKIFVKSFLVFLNCRNRFKQFFGC